MSNTEKTEDNYGVYRLLVRALAYGAYGYSLYLILFEEPFEYNPLLAIVLSIIGTGLLIGSDHIRD